MNSIPDGVLEAKQRIRKAAIIPPVLKPSEWAESNVRIPLGNAITGLVRFANAPYQVEPLNLADDENCRRISLMFGAQTGKTQIMLMAKAYFIAYKPQSIMMMQPSQSDLKTWLHGKFNTLVESTPSLEKSLASPRSREGVNNQEMKSFIGGALMFAWSGSPKTMRGRSAPKIFCDEIDGYARTEEGDPVSLLWQRAATFGDQRLLVESSTPTIKHRSAIESAFEEGDQRRWFVPCHECGGSQYLKWSQVKWNKDEAGHHDPASAYYECEHCRTKWDDLDRRAAIRAGEWIAAKPYRGHASYHLPEMASLFRKLEDIVESFLEKKAKGDLQTFVNVSLAETWEQEGHGVDVHEIAARRESYLAPVPDGGLVLVAAVDVQKDRLEMKVAAFGHGFECWCIDYQILWGDPTQEDVWQQLEIALMKSYRHESGVEMGIISTFVDSGYLTDRVYEFCRGRALSRVFPIKGVGGARPIISRTTPLGRDKTPVVPLGVDTLKDLVMGRLIINKPGAGYIHYPLNHDGFDDEYFEQLTAEQAMTEYKHGREFRVWKSMRPRNEAWDLMCYCTAAILKLNPDFEALEEMQREQIALINAPEVVEVEPEETYLSREMAKRVEARSPIRKPRKRSFLV